MSSSIEARTKEDPAFMGITAELARELEKIGDWGLLTTDASLTITGSNPWLERHIGGQAAAFLGRPLFEVFPDLVARKLDRYFQQALGGQTVLLSQRLHQYLLPLPAPSAKDRFAFMQQTARILPLVDTRQVIGADVVGTVTVLEDVTERVAYEIELRERVAALREADARKDEFLAMLAHELRNPLAPIRHAAQIQRLKASADPEMQWASEVIERQVRQLTRLVDDLLDVSRVSQGKIALRLAPVDLASVVRQAVEISQPLIDSRKHHLEISLTDRHAWVEGDEIRLSQVVANLLNNAAKYTAERGRIWLTLEASGDEAVVRVRDSGVGIDAEMLPRLFELFAQSPDARSRAEGGLGIGLNLVRSLVQMHGGRVEAFSQGPGRGSEFVVHLPGLREPPHSAVDEPKRSSAEKAARRVLLVDDNPDAAEALARLLRVLGHEVRTAHDGPTALDAARAQPPDVVFCDIGLPGMDGLEVCRRMRRESGLAGTMLVALTGYGREDDVRRSQEAGFNAHLVKPANLSTLQELLAQTTARR